MYDISGKTFYQLATDPDFWRDLNPSMTITEAAQNKPVKAVEISRSAIAATKEMIVEEGYFKLESFVEPAKLKDLANCVRKLHAENWPETFAFVYDDFWQLFQRTSFVMAELLGREYKQMPNLWMFYLECNSQSRGWVPHRDRMRAKTLDADGYPQSINIWLPLTDATPENGCMYMLPAGYDENYKGDLGVQLVTSLQDIRAVPARAGDFLGWNEAVFHWGGRSSKLAKYPRISMATVYQNGKVDPLEWPLMQPGAIPPFIERVGLISQQFLRFQVQNTYTTSTEILAKELSVLSEPIQHFDSLNPYKKSKIMALKNLIGAAKKL
jgi:hypothetical protein